MYFLNDDVDELFMGDGIVVYKGQPVKTKYSRYHPFVNHNFWIDRIGKCPYCHNGSVPVHSCQIDADGNWINVELVEG